MPLILRLVTICLALSSARADPFAFSKLVQLNEENWGAMLNGEWMVEFYAPWCPACKSIATTWEEFAVAAGKHKVHVAVIDVVKSPSLNGRFFITALPTIYHVKDGKFRQYRGTRSTEAFLAYITNSQWKNVEPLSAWKQPNSMHMSVLSYFFKLSHYLKDVNTHLHEDYGMPSWGSYALFAIATIFLGAILGLILVCIVDFVYPPKKSHRQSFSETKERGQGGSNIEEIPADELEDEEPEVEEDEPNASTSDEEKNSGTDSDIDELKAEESGDNAAKNNDGEKQTGEDKEKKPKPEGDIIADVGGDASSPEVRKRKPRKD